MFDPTSRYFGIETATYLQPEGREVAYLRRRFQPRAEDLQTLQEVTVTEGERLDLIAARTLNDPQQFWRIADANNAMNPRRLEAPGTTLRVAVPRVEGGF